jgi:hypothetical protein
MTQCFSISETHPRDGYSVGNDVSIIDDEGRLFGVINVVDAVVVVFALAFLIAGVSLVYGVGPEPETSSETRYVTLDLGEQPTYVADRISEGEVLTADDRRNRTITDVYRTRSNGNPHVFARIAVNGTVTEGHFEHAGEPLRLGRELTLQTESYETQGQITAVDEVDSTLAVTETDVVVRTTLDASDAEQLSVGDQYRLGESTLATVRTIEAYGTQNPDRRLAYIGLTYRTYEPSGTPRFGQTPVEVGATLPFRHSSYRFDSTVVRLGTVEPRGERRTQTVTVELEHVDQQTAAAIQVGQSETVRGETIAGVTGVERTPSTVVVTSDDGEVLLREHPTEVDVRVTTELAVRETALGTQFKGQSLRIGEQITLDFDHMTIRPTVVDISSE